MTTGSAWIGLANFDSLDSALDGPKRSGPTAAEAYRDAVIRQFLQAPDRLAL